MSTKPEAVDDKEPPKTQSEPLGLDCVRALFDRHEVPPHKRATTIAEVLGKSPQHAYRLLKGESPWSLEMLADVAKHFGEELGEVLSTGMPDGSRAGHLVTDETLIPCRFWLNERAQHAPIGALVAEQVGDEWHVKLHKERGPMKGRLVRRLIVEQQGSAWRVAVLDDHMDSADNLTLALNDAGFNAQAFYSEEALRKAIAKVPFDAYLLDWILGDTSAKSLVSWIRQADSECIVGVMTGEIDTGRVLETELRDAVNSYGLQFVIDKPYRATLVAAQLSQAFAAK